MSKRFLSENSPEVFFKALRAIAKACKSHENPCGPEITKVGECEYEFTLVMNGKRVNIIEMLTSHLAARQKTYSTISGDRDHLDIFLSMVEIADPYEVSSCLLTSKYCAAYKRFKMALRTCSSAMGTVN